MTAPLHLDPTSLTALHDGSLDAADAARLADALRVKPGARSWATRAALAERDNLIREYARRCYPVLTKNQQAEHVYRDLARYATSAWQRARADLDCRHHDGRRQLLWRILRVRPYVPSSRSIRKILAAS